MPSQKSRNRATEVSAEYTVEEARRIAKRVVERQKARSGGVEMALWDCARMFGIEEGSLRTLWEKRHIKSVKGHVLDRLREIDAWLNELENRERENIKAVAIKMEEAGHPAARLARAAAEFVASEEGP